jgi:hypothetical protein
VTPAGPEWDGGTPVDAAEGWGIAATILWATAGWAWFVAVSWASWAAFDAALLVTAAAILAELEARRKRG